MLNNEEETLPLSVHDIGEASVVNVEVRCERTPEAFGKWQLDTFNAIMTAYRDQKAAYEEQLAAAAIRQGTAIAGRNPIRNREIEREELKKACIRMMSGEDYSGFNAMGPGGTPKPYPEINIAEATVEGQKIQFFEQGFEWDQMSYLFYPYFWGTKDHWIDVHQLEDVDPLFTKFLQAGAARVCVVLVVDLLYKLPENRVSQLGGMAAIVAALCPTACDSCDTGFISILHYGAAAILFSAIVYFCLIAFRYRTRKKMNDPEKLRMAIISQAGRQLTESELNQSLEKWLMKLKRRGKLYLAFGLVIAAIMLALLHAFFAVPETIFLTWRLTFVAETNALVLFGFAWLTASKSLKYFSQDAERYHPLSRKKAR